MSLPNLDKEFESQLDLARKLILKIRNKRDRAIAIKYINVLTSFKSNDPLVKRNRNGFFKYFLQVLENQLTVETKLNMPCTCPIEHQPGTPQALKYLQKEVLESEEKVTSHWSKDKKTYVSAKMLPGRGALLYMAVSSEPDGEWDTRPNLPRS